MTIKFNNQIISFVDNNVETTKINSLDINKEYGMEYRIGVMDEGNLDTFKPCYLKQLRIIRNGSELVSGWQHSVEMAHTILNIAPNNNFFWVRHFCIEFVVVLANFKIRGFTSTVKREMRKKYQRKIVDCVIAAQRGDIASKQILENAICGYIYTKFFDHNSGDLNIVTVFDVLNTNESLKRVISKDNRFTQRDLSKGYLVLDYKHLDLTGKKRDEVYCEHNVAA